VAYLHYTPRHTMAKFCTQTSDDHVQDICWVYVYRGRRYENNDIFQKCVQVGQHLCSGDLRSVGGTVGSRPRPYTSRLAGRLQQRGPLQWRRRRVAIWLALRV